MRLLRGYYDVFVGTCAKFPSRVAVRLYEGAEYKNYTYSELFGVCEYISQNLQQLKCTKGIIGLISERNILIPCVIAAAHKCCTTFMFIDPTQDVTTLANNITFTILITIKNKDNDNSQEILGKKPDRAILVFDLLVNFYNCAPKEQDDRHIDQHSFIAMTSGSTGEPKHIQVPIQCIQPNIDDLTKMFNIVPEDIIYFSTPLTFDPSMVEILLACMNGASLLIAPDKADILFPSDNENSITFWQTTPSKFFQHSNLDIKNKILSADSTLKVLALGGEPLNGTKRLKELKHHNNKSKIFTLYGVTEMSCWACAAELDLEKELIDREVPLGACLSETEVVIESNKRSNEQSGSIILVSKTRTCYILSKPKRQEVHNALKYVDTGDLGEVKNGTIYYRGRKDDIIKRFGHKVNLQHIEATAMICPKIKTCSCVWLPKPMLLVVYFSSETFSSQELSGFLKCKLDDKHWPDKIVRVHNLPTNRHGKISKQIITKLYENVNSNPQTKDTNKSQFLKELNATLNHNYANFDQVKDKDFFSIGGTSFLAIAMCNKLSIMCPQLGQLILPWLLSGKLTIGEVLQLSEKETRNRKVKRCLSDSESMEEHPTVKKSLCSLNGNSDCLIIAWSFNTGKCVDASPTLFQTEECLYVTVGSHSGKIIVMDAIEGTPQGVITINSRVEAPVLCLLGTSGPCGVVGCHDGTVICFTLAGCKELWRTNVGAMVKSKAVCCNGLVYIAGYDGNLRCLDLMTGAIKLTIAVSDQGISADLVVGKSEYVVVGSLAGAVGAARAGARALAWRAALGGPVFAAPALLDRDKFAVFAEVSGEIHCRTVEKGITIWRYSGAKGNIFSSLYIREVDKTKWQMVFGCFDDKVYSVIIKNFQPSLHWKAQMTSPVYSTPCGLGDKVLAASNNGILSVLNADSGQSLAEYRLPNDTFSSPVSYADYVFIGCRDDNLYSLKFNLKV